MTLEFLIVQIVNFCLALNSKKIVVVFATENTNCLINKNELHIFSMARKTKWWNMINLLGRDLLLNLIDIPY